MSKLRDLRKKRGLTLLEAANAIGGIDAGNLSRIERGEQVPHRDTALKIQGFYKNKITLDEIIYPRVN
jgi:transcriptional regulator with XRE-family HTH domain